MSDSAPSSSSSSSSSSSCWQRVPWLAIMRVAGGALGILIIVLGIIGIITNSFSPRQFVDNCYQVLFGCLIVLAELRFQRALTFFSFLCSYTGLGLFYVFVGGLALGGEWYNYVLAICFLTIGVTYTAMGCCYGKQMYIAAPSSSATGAGAGAVHEQALTPAAAFGSSHSSAVQASSSSSGLKAHSQGAQGHSARQPIMQADQTPDSAWPDDDDRV